MIRSGGRAARTSRSRRIPADRRIDAVANDRMPRRDPMLAQASVATRSD